MRCKSYVTMDGNSAAAYVAYPFTEVAAIYPITPSSPMAEKTDFWAASGKLNMFGQPVSLVEMQSEAGAIAAVHGALQTGALSTSFTSSQGLMLMIPVLHRISGEHLPCVLHVASRTVGTHAMSIFGDHSDVMNCRQCGFAMICTGSVQEVMDLAGVAHLAAIKGRIPFMHFFDGFRTSHELTKIECIDTDRLTALVDHEALAAFRSEALTPDHPLIRGTVQNSDIYFQVREASEPDYRRLPSIVEEYFAAIGDITGREYHIYDYYGAPDAEFVTVAMGSVCGALRDAVDYVNAGGGRAGVLQVRLYRPFDISLFIRALPRSVRKVAVLDRCKEMGSSGEPLFQDVSTAVLQERPDVRVYGGRYGLSSKDTSPSQLVAVYRELEKESPRRSFTVGIQDDVCRSSLSSSEEVPSPEGMRSCIFWGLGSDGTVGANKNSVEIINSSTSLWAQAYFEYDAKKSYGLTRSHLRIANEAIRSSHLVRNADLIACHTPAYIGVYDMLEGLKEGGAFLLNCPWTDSELADKLPADMIRTLMERHARLYVIDAASLAQRLGLGNHINIPLQAAFFKITHLIPTDQAGILLSDAIRKTYFAKGSEVVSKNISAVSAGFSEVREVRLPILEEALLADSARDKSDAAELPAPVRNILQPLNAMKGDDLPVSMFTGYRDGRMDMGMTAWEKRDIAVQVPKWNPAACIQCGKCTLVCPHSVLRPHLISQDQAAAAPKHMQTARARGKGTEGFRYTLQISIRDCTGCGSCVSCCPLSGKALRMIPRKEARADKESWSYVLGLPSVTGPFDKYSVKGSQFLLPYLEFSAACAGCGETPYARLLTQLFGDRVYWANATGCSQAWGAAMPGIPYCTDADNHGPAWTNSLFENNAEFALGMLLSVRQQRNALKMRIEKLCSKNSESSLLGVAEAWLEGFDEDEGSREASSALLKELRKLPPTRLVREILASADHLAKKCFWMFGGDGWAYDIGFGGLDHVLASGEDINVFIIDTEVYSNTGGQASKSTARGAAAQFCASGKKSAKKDLGAILMSYGSVYVAQVAMGANPEQMFRAIKEAAAYKGPSVIIAYAPCISHGIRAGMANVQQEMKRAVDSGYWPLYRYNPSRQHPFTLDSPERTLPYQDFLRGENRYASLLHMFPQDAGELFRRSEEDADARFERYRMLSEL